MKSFSQRKGIKPVKSVIQVDSMDNDLENGLWNALSIYYWDRVITNSIGKYVKSDSEGFFRQLWLDYFKKPLDTLSSYWSPTRAEIRKYFFNCEWYEAYDFIEFVVKNYPDEPANRKFKDYCNSILKNELSAYRFVGEEIAQITSEEEIAEIQEALEESSRPVNIHLRTALNLLADRKSPDYRNSIKESISAVEAICKLITGNVKATLADALKEIEKEKKVELHSALKKAFDSLYGYTSDAEGIRHALLSESNLDFEDAKFMLVSCSAFVNYLITKSSKAGIKV